MSETKKDTICSLNKNLIETAKKGIMRGVIICPIHGGHSLYDIYRQPEKYDPQEKEVNLPKDGERFKLNGENYVRKGNVVEKESWSSKRFENFKTEFGVLRTADGNHAISIELFDLIKMENWFRNEISQARKEGAEEEAIRHQKEDLNAYEAGRKEERALLCEKFREIVANDDEDYISEEIRKARNRMKWNLIHTIESELKEEGK